jgi:hypothetical protein
LNGLKRAAFWRATGWANLKLAWAARAVVASSPIGRRKTLGTARSVISNLDDDRYDAGDEPYLELVRDSLKLIKAESISYELDTRSIDFYDKNARQFDKF